MRNASLVVSGSVFLSLTVVALVSACSSTSDPTLGSSGSTTKDGGSSGAVADARNPYPSFKGDVVPIIQQSCSLTACHASKESNLGILLQYDPMQLYTELQKTSPTSKTAFVVAGDPAASYVILKLEGKQSTLAAKCPSSGQELNCGNVMPPDDPLPAAKIKVFTDWIMAGAKND
ncbi:MAG: hypothetical protein JWO86_2358 [Myxococcaceae bacterium]|nr:hypothetical protein [Myxococcaceae bacterium]